MSEDYMITRPRNPNRESIQLVKMMQFMIDNDCHKWIIAKETGNLGYDHWQIRLRIRNLTKEEKENFAYLKQYFGESAHIEECSDTWKYEYKDGEYYDDGDLCLDRIERLQARYGDLREWQQRALELVLSQDVRQVDVLYDQQGNKGKSWLVNHLYETQKAYYIPPSLSTVEKLVQSVASCYINGEWKPIVVIDIPRGYKWSPQLAVAIEQVKDGIVSDPRYSYNTVNIRGVKVLVCTNNEPPKKMLSEDRWRITTLW